MAPARDAQWTRRFRSLNAAAVREVRAGEFDRAAKAMRLRGRAYDQWGRELYGPKARQAQLQSDARDLMNAFRL